VFSLTRSSFAGQQTTGATLWSGDISGTWDSLRRQVAASINYAMSGMPYWSEDIGGFFRPSDQYTSEDYHSLLIRWFQFGVFTPIYRVHGGGSNTEIWNYGPQVERVVNATHNLRYRLLPYTYSGFARVYSEGYTMQRAVGMVWPQDLSARSIADQFMWGDAFMVAPIVSQAADNATAREVYLPAAGAPWTCFWMGIAIDLRTERIRAAAPIEHSPLFVRAGSIVPMGPYLQHTGEKTADPLEVRVYGGADGTFELYEDDGMSPQPCASSSITFQYTHVDGKMTISARKGSFDGMLEQRTINLVLVGKSHGAGLEPEASPDKVVAYDGSAVTVAL